jgi:SAM-dependent methyltransferase
MDSDAWDRRYAGADLVWGVGPNRIVEAELGGLAPGSAVDVGCGEGRNALWLATRGWRATGLDFSPVAIERGRRLAAEAGVSDRATFEVCDVVGGDWPPGPFDAVVLAYLQLPAAQRRIVLRKAAEVLAPDGVLLVVAHDASNIAEGTGGPQDPEVLYTAADVVGDVDGLGLAVERAERVQRPVDGAPRPALDALVRLRRPAAADQRA